MAEADSRILVEIQKELRGRIFDRYDKKSSAFNTLMTALIAFSIVFFAFVLLPYVTLEYQKWFIDAKIAAAASGVEIQSKAMADRTAELEAKRADLGQRARALDETRTKVAAAEDQVKQLKDTLQSKESTIKSTAEEIGKANDSLNRLQGVQNTIAGVSLSADDNVQELRKYIIDLRSEYESGRLQPNEYCPQPENDAKVTCLVQRKVQEQIDRVISKVTDGVVKPLSDADPALAGGVASRLQKLQQDLESRPLKDPNFWKTVDTKRLLYSDFEREFEGFANEVVDIARQNTAGLQDQLKTLTARIKQLDNESTLLKANADAIQGELDRLGAMRRELDALYTSNSAEIKAAEAAVEQLNAALQEATRGYETSKREANDERDRISKTEDEIAKRLSSIQSPLGTLPIGLTEANLAFPAIIALAFLISALMLVDALRLRAAFHDLCRQVDPSGQVLGDHEVVMIAPLWLDPESRGLKQSLAFIALLLPAIIFAAAIVLNVYSWTITDIRPIGGNITRTAFGVAYAMGAAMIFVALLQFRMAWKSSSRRRPAGSAAAAPLRTLA